MLIYQTKNQMILALIIEMRILYHLKVNHKYPQGLSNLRLTHKTLIRMAIRTGAIKF